MNRKSDIFASAQASGHELNLVRVNIRSGTLNGRRQVQNDLSIWSRLPNVHHRFANLQGKILLCIDEDLRRVLQAHHGAFEQLFSLIHDPLHPAGCQRNGGCFVIAEDNFAEQRRRCVVDVDCRSLKADKKFNSAINDVRARQCQD